MAEFIAIGDGVIDYAYQDKNADKELRDAFLSFIRPENPPRKGEQVFLSHEEWVDKVIAFGQNKAIITNADTAKSPLVSKVLTRIFGEPRVAAGCASANTFDGIACAKINGKPLVTSTFITGIGEGMAGQIFLDSLPEGSVRYAQRFGYMKEFHVFEVDGDRIGIANESRDHGASRFLTPGLLDDNVKIDNDTKMIMIDSYMIYMDQEGKLYGDFLDKAIEKTKAVSTHPATRPTIVLNTASQPLAERRILQSALDKATAAGPVIIVTNTGELRRLLNMDKHWRKKHEAKWCGLQGNALEKAKDADDEYQCDKLLANKETYRAAYHRYCEHNIAPVTFLVTNAHKPAQVIDRDGISAGSSKPIPVDPAEDHTQDLVTMLTQGYPTLPPPRGVQNTVGAGDAAAAGFLLGKLRGLTQSHCVALGLMTASYVIGYDSARLPAQKLEYNGMKVEGLPSYLVSATPFDPNATEYELILSGLRR